MSAQVDAYEKLGAFYLGRPFDPATGTTGEQPLLYDAKDLTTHAVCVGMTGSGKTGLCITLIEEAAIDGVPSLIVDVKGDLGNLLLTFPELRPADFRPWIDEAQAQREGLTADQLAENQAELWRKGLGKWDQDGERIRRLRQSAEFAIYTPGSEAGLPISILSSFAAPSAAVREDHDLLQERIATTTASLLGLLGLDADPIRSRESILLSNLFDRAWKADEDLDLATLIGRIQNPPLDRVGVMPLESFYPEKERFELAMALNNLLAAPSFQSWLQGEPLDVDGLLYTPEGKPRVAIFSIAHLADAERMFFVSLLLNQTLGWMRGRSGTSSLRALLYMDEVFGYLPPVAEPPSKKPLLTLLKQARAYGVGVVLATQNPVDLDYKALSNIGTWLLGRLQTERDKARVMDGLLAAEGGLTKDQIESILSGVEKRVFMLHNVHESHPELFRVRWAMSYLRGPLTRDQIRQLSGSSAPSESAQADAAAPPAPSSKPVAPVAAQATAAASAATARPLLPSDVVERFLPLRGRAGDDVLYRPRLVADCRVHFVDKRRNLETSEELLLTATAGEHPADTDWFEAEPLDLVADDLERTPVAGVRFADLPAAAGDVKSFRKWQKAVADVLYRSRRYELWRVSAYKLTSEPGESERDFRIRVADVARETRDGEVEELREKYARKQATLEERLRRAEQKLDKEREQAKDHKLQTAISIGTSLLGAFLGRGRVTSHKAATASRRIGRSFKEGQDVGRAEDDVAACRERLAALEDELRREVDELEDRFDAANAELETVQLKPRRIDVEVRLLALGWAPYRVADGIADPAW